MFRKQLRSKNISLLNQVAPDCFAYADENHLRIVLRNLLGNAVKFTSEGGTISVNSVEESNFVKISVTDTGVGMAEEKIQHLFLAENNNTQLGTNGEIGTGLGLLLCKEFVEKNGGNIWVESELTKGSSFYFTLPKA